MASIAPRRPLRDAAPLAALAAVALAFDADPRLPWLAGVAGAALFAGAAALRGLQARRELRQLRETADRLILDGSELAAWRAHELTSRATRDRLRAEIERTLRSVSPHRLPSASPLNRPAVRRDAELLRLVLYRLDAEAPVAPRGVLLARGLLCDPDSPLYAEHPGARLPRALTRVLGALEP